MIRQALYGGKAAGQDFSNHLQDCMWQLGFISSLADPDVWIQEAVTAEVAEYWEYILVYTDNVLVITDTGEKTLRDGIGKYFQLNKESFSETKIYLGGHSYLGNCQDAWDFGSSQYCQAAVANNETFLAESNAKLLPEQRPQSKHHIV